MNIAKSFNSKRAVKYTAAAAAIGLFLYKYRQAGAREKEEKRRAPSTRKKAVRVDAVFARRLMKLMKICFPRLFCVESGLLLCHTIVLLTRTWASVHMATLEGMIVKALVEKQAQRFVRLILVLLAVGVPLGFCNALIKFFQEQLALRFRSRLTRHTRSLFLSNLTYYRVLNLDSRLKNPDQMLTNDVDKFSTKVAELYSSLAKPVVDLTIFNTQLASSVGLPGFLVMTASVHVGTAILRLTSPAFGKLVAHEQELEGDYRFSHSRVITHAEEIAFYDGAETEAGTLEAAYKELARHVHNTSVISLSYGALNQFITKYYWAAVGYGFSALPVFFAGGRDAEVSSAAAEAKLVQATGSITDGADDAMLASKLSERTRVFVSNRRLLLSINDAFTRLLESTRDISALSGTTARLADMLDVFEDVRIGRYVRLKPVSGGALQGEAAAAPEAHVSSAADSKAVIEMGSKIACSNLAIRTPTGEILVKGMNFAVEPGEHLLITGPNGCGKSSLFRTLAGLWEAADGHILRPPGRQLFYIPQKPYLCIGSLKRQIIYPDEQSSCPDSQLVDLLKMVKLDYLVDREGGFEAVREWADVLSGGEKQRIAMARLFYHRPLYAVLDECTSAVSQDVEGLMYTKAKELKMSLVTVSHRQSLWKYHDVHLKMDGRGGWSFEKMIH